MSDDGLRALRDHGPFETERAASLASRAHERTVVAYRPGILSEENARVLAEAAACSSGIEIGDHDQHVLDWIAGWEPSTVNAVAGLIHRAYRVGRGDGASEAAAARGGEDSR